MSFYDVLALFVTYSVLGWCAEVIYAGVTTGRIINRGFLNGPVCPIYGFGMVGVLLLLRPFTDTMPLLFVTGMLLCSLLELVGGWALEKFFHTRWWDYTKRPMNIGGYVCLSFSILWGLAVVFVVRLVQPAVLYAVELLPQHLPTPLVWGIVIVVYLLYAADLALTLVTIIGLQNRIKELEQIASALHTLSDGMSEQLGKRAIAADAKLDAMKAAGEARLDADREDIRDGIAVLSEQKRQLQESIAWQGHRISESAAETRQKAGAVLAEGLDRLTDEKDELQESLASRLAELENRRSELLKSINASRFGTRRLIDAFPALHHALRARILPESRADKAFNPDQPPHQD